MSKRPANPNDGLSASASVPRSASPLGLGSLFQKPTKWFQRSNSARSNASPTEGRTSFQKGSKISGPTNPRPYPQQDQLMPSSRSVLSLSMNRSTSQLAVSIPPSSPGSPRSDDLRATAGKKWSRSVDDLSKFSPRSPESPPPFLSSPTRSRIDEYRAQSGIRIPASAGPGTVAFPTNTIPEESEGLAPNKKHGRSLSFGRHKEPAPTSAPTPVPALPSRIPVKSPHATQLLTSLNAAGTRPSFERGNSHSSEKEKTSSAGSVTNTGYSVRTFGFPFMTKPGSGGTLPSPSQQAPPQIVLSTVPDLNVSAPEPTRKSSKRASQTVMHQGFLMKLEHPIQQHTPGKAYKAVLVGSKLQFYKSPGGGGAELRELFPDGLVQPDIEEQVEAEAEADVVSVGGRERSSARRKFWGRGRHPELSVQDEHDKAKRQVHGTLDALVHEVVFCTTLPEANLISEREAFARCVLLCLPSAVAEKEEFDEALMRYLGRALSAGGAEDEKEREKDREWVEWCVGTYALMHGELDTTWNEWMEKASLDLSACIGRAAPDVVAKGAKAGGVMGSPYTGVFSPRPSNGGSFENVPSLGLSLPKTNTSTNALGIPVTPNVKPAPGVVLPANALTADTFCEFFARPSKLGITLERDRLSRDVFLRIPSATIAKSLRVLNQAFLVLAVGSGTWSSDSANAQSSTIDGTLPPARFLQLPRGTDPASLFCGSDDAPHWLTRLVMTQVLSPDMVGHELPASDTAASMHGGQGGHAAVSEGVKVSRTHTRAAVLCKWIRLGELARVAGDECTWRAVQAAVCARAIARLERVFRRMSDEEREIVSAWAREDTTRGLGAGGRCTPWESDVRERIGREMERARVRGVTGGAWRIGPFEEVAGMVEGVEKVWGECGVLGGGTLPLADADVEDVVGLVRYFRRHAEDEELVRSKHIADYNGLSFAIEPRRNKHYAPHFFRNKPPQASHPLAPLLFPELMPTITMLDRSNIVRGKKLSSHSHGEVGGSVEMSQEHIQAVVTRTKAFQAGGADQTQNKRGKTREPQDVRLLGEDLGETTLTVFEGELVLKLMATPAKEGEGEKAQMPLSRSTTMLRNVSRPASVVEEEDSIGVAMSGSGVLVTPSKLERKPSRTPSIRATPSSHLERKQSAIRSRRSSLPSISQRASMAVAEASEEPPLRALVSSGSLERLVDVLVSGLEEVGMQTSPADDNGETSLREGRTRGIRVDHAEYCKIFWGVFRSFVTPMVLFEMIQKRYQNAASRKSFAPTVSNFVRFSSQHPDEAQSDAETESYKAEILQTLTNWILEGGGGQDLLDDTDFYDGMYKFLMHSNVSQLAPLRDLFKRVTRRPSMEVVPGPSAGQTSTGFGSSAPCLGDIDPETLADNLDAIAAAAFKPVTSTDLIIALDLLETQSADRLGWYVVSDLPAASDDLSIQNIYTQLQEVDTSGLISEMGPDKFVRNLPSSIRSVFRAHDIVRRWAIMNIVTPRLGVQVRQERIELFLQTIEVCRLRTADAPAAQDLHQPSIRTFTETALGAALCSPESRLFTRAWQDVGTARGTSIESLSSLLSVRRVESIRSSRRMTADMGWLIECMLELLSLPDKSNEGGSGVELINFDKRRYLSNLISNAPNLQPLRRQQLRSNTHRADVDRMTSMQREIADSFYELRVLKEEAYKENVQSSPVHAAPRKVTRPFQRIVLEQIEKNKRDKYARERLQKELKAERLISERRDDNINKAMFPKGQHGQRKKSRSMSGFFTMLRPISAAWSSEKIQDKMMRPRTLQELDFEPVGKPSWVLSLANAQVQDFVNKQRSFVMRLRTEDGGLYYLQALEQQDATRWLTVLQETSTNYARRRLTYQGKSDPTEVGAPSWNANTKHPHPVYGVPLYDLLEREYGKPPPADAIPRIIKLCIQEVESRGLTESGIYRLVPSTTDLAQLRDMFDSGAAFEGPLDPFLDIMTFTSALKAWFRSLPECIFTNALYQDFMNNMRDTNFDSKYTRLRELIHSLPPANFQLVRTIFEHLDRVTDFEEQNQMNADNLATCLAQSLVFPPGGSGGIFPINLGEHNNLVKSLVVQYHWIFEEAEAEHEEEEDGAIDEDAVASDSEDIEEAQDTGASSSRLNMSEDEVFTHGPSQISLVTNTWNAST